MQKSDTLKQFLWEALCYIDDADALVDRYLTEAARRVIEAIQKAG